MAEVTFRVYVFRKVFFFIHCKLFRVEQLVMTALQVESTNGILTRHTVYYALLSHLLQRSLLGLCARSISVSSIVCLLVYVINE